MRKTLLAIITFISVIAAGVPRCCAQEARYKFDIGGSIGMSGYLGDINQSNMFRRPGLSVNGMFHYIANARWGVRGQLGVLTLSGDSRDFSNVFPENVNIPGGYYSFSTTSVDLGGRLEFNFFPYGIGETYKRLKRWTPFLSLGLGATLTMGGGTHIAFGIPMGVGVKYKLKERLNLIGEFSMTKLLGDHVDGPLSDLYGIKHTFAKNTDWHSSITVGITYEFGERCETCNRID